ncbi:MAG TPA: alcohol dehydrogenase catalytic domain-containing protein, partial [Novosphingobium sp.]|nr:alcohol dehydrogenase catalytic domain-containing protein [Novosphingobium sp.]
MQALQIQALSPDLSGCALVELPAPDPATDQVLVRVRAASLNFPDLLMTRGEYQLKPPLPFVPGMDFAGVVVESAGGFAAGDEVVGATRLGAFAETVAVDAAALHPKPAALDFAVAASYGAAYLTAYVALVELGGLEAGQ